MHGYLFINPLTYLYSTPPSCSHILVVPCPRYGLQGASRRLEEQIDHLATNTTAQVTELAAGLDLARASLQLHQTLHENTNHSLDTIVLAQVTQHINSLILSCIQHLLIDTMFDC